MENNAKRKSGHSRNFTRTALLPHHYSHWTPSTHVNHRQNGGEESSKGEGEVEGDLSDMEGSQVSLPRSYTLPREFKYHHPNNTARERERRVGNNKVPASRFYLPSTNSSDGDVDSADNEEETDSEVHYRMKNNHESNNHNETQQQQQQRFAFEDNNKNEFLNPDSSATVIMSGNSYLNNSQGLLRPSSIVQKQG